MDLLRKKKKGKKNEKKSTPAFEQLQAWKKNNGPTAPVKLQTSNKVHSDQQTEQCDQVRNTSRTDIKELKATK